MTKYSNYFIACHDAGAANIIMSGELAKGFPAKFYCLQGPALVKWRSCIPSHKLCHDLNLAISNCAMLRSGTGWASDFEHNARLLAMAGGLHVIAVIDHWVNYEKRFIRHKQCILPNEIEVMDKHAQNIATQTFPSVKVTLKHNYYLDMIIERAGTADIQRKNDILYVLEPVPENWGAEFTISEEFQALNYFRDYIQQVFSPPYEQIRLRLHPSESKEKYLDWAEQNQNLRLVFDEYADIETSIANANWVFGCESYGLVVALHCGKEVYSTIPAWAPLARLPHSKLKHVRHFMPAAHEYRVINKNL